MSITLANVSLLSFAALASLHVVDSTENSGGTLGLSYSAAVYPLCGGQSQSPVDIEQASTVFTPDYDQLTLHNYSEPPDHVTFTINNTGHTVRVSALNNNGSIGVSSGGLSRYYNLAQFHFHWSTVDNLGSEHTLDTQAYAMEIHLVHYSSAYDDINDAMNKTGGLAVIGVFVQIGDENSAFNTLINNFERVKYRDEAVEVVDMFSLQQLLPGNTREFYRYDGSLTTPPCYQSVIWTVFKHAITVTHRQLEAFRELCFNERNDGNERRIANNFRRTNSLNGRTVYRSFQQLETGGGVAVHSTSLAVLHSVIFTVRLFL